MAAHLSGRIRAPSPALAAVAEMGGASLERGHMIVAHDLRMQEAVEMVGRRWSGAIVWALLAGPQRFNHLLNGIPHINDRILTIRLNEMIEEGMVERHVVPGPPTVVSYGLTAKGKALRPILEATRAWAQA
jgi:DNA-binding HxlR family transcriptional regulator